MPAVSGAQLFSMVKAYAELGIHRSGTAVDAATASWMAERLRDRGLDPVIEPVDYDRWVASSRLTVDGREVDHLALPYEWTGRVSTDRVFVDRVDPKSGGAPEFMDAALAELDLTAHDAAVLATDHPNGSLVGVNRRIDARRGPVPVLLIAGRDLETIRMGPLRVEIEAGVEPGQTFNVIARNAVAGRPLILTTPLNGWFGCAGERGTGIAVLLALVAELAHLPLLVVATGGHELSYLGGHHWVDNGDVDPAAVLHVGASVAVEHDTPDGRALIPTRLAMTSLAAEAAAPLTEALTPIGLRPACSVERWLGEGEAFSKLGVPLLSFTGAGVDFHTPEDTPERATSPAALALVAEAFANAATALDAIARTEPRHG